MFQGKDGTITTVGMCQIELIGAEELEPGSSGAAHLRLADGVDHIVKTLAEVGTEFAIAEGTHVVGGAKVTGIS
jgi:hypothetical protein